MFKVFTATVASVSGFTAICILCDEVAKWKDADTGANPARDVIASLRPTMATVKTARMYISSSAFSTVDYHYDLFSQGDTAATLTAYAPTWEANDAITEADTHNLEPDERVWSREYLAVPSSSAFAVFAPEFIDRALNHARDFETSGEEVPHHQSVERKEGCMELGAEHGG